ncbi:MAG: ubiquinone/menaquinone biosynthesis methyltransferase [Methanobacteriota archaeon]
MSDRSKVGSERRDTYVQEMFDAIADRYDAANTAMTLSWDARWRRRVAARVAPQPGERILDVGCGTGRLAGAVLAREPRASVVGVDLSSRMIHVARQEARGKRPAAFVAGDALRLPFPDARFDAAINGFVLRNVPDPGRFFSEMRRVLRPGGRLVSLEAAEPSGRLARALHRGYFRRVAPWIGGVVTGKRWAYDYLATSLDGFPSPDELVALQRKAGFADVSVESVGFGAARVYVARSL